MERVRLLPKVIALAAVMTLVQVECPVAAARPALVNFEIAQAQTDAPPATLPASTAPAATSTAPAAASTPPAAAASPEPAKPPADKPANSPDASGTSAAVTPVFPTAIDPKYSREPGIVSRMRTCADQFTANKATNANGGMKWIDRSGGYYGVCVKHLKG